VGYLSQAELESAIDAEWQTALGDVDLDPARAKHFKTAKTPDKAAQFAAMCWPAASRTDDRSALSVSQRAEANSSECCQLHRIEIHLDYGQPAELDPDGIRALFGAVIRHELEHARQDEECGEAPLRLYLLAREGYAEQYGPLIPNKEMNQAPIELDANAASTVYLREHHPDQVDAIKALENNGNLARGIGPPEPLETLVGRSTEFTFRYRAGLEQKYGKDFGEDLKQIHEEAAKTWQRLAEQADD